MRKIPALDTEVMLETLCDERVTLREDDERDPEIGFPQRAAPCSRMGVRSAGGGGPIELPEQIQKDLSMRRRQPKEANLGGT